MARPWPAGAPSADERAAVASAAPVSFWLDGLPERPPHPPLHGDASADLCIVGGGFTGLWAAIHAKRDDPGRDVLLLEGGSIGRAASGRNGGFCSSSLTHGLSNGAQHFGEELATLERLGQENLAELLADLEQLGIDAHAREVAEVAVAVEPHELPLLEHDAELYRDHGYEAELLDREQMQARIASPTYLGGALVKGTLALLDPGRLAEGLRQAASSLGVRLHEGSVVDGLDGGSGGGVELLVRGGDPAAPQRLGRRRSGAEQADAGGTVHAGRVVLATGAHRSLLASARWRIAPIYDYAVVTEPLSAAQWASLGWAGGDGVSDCGNQFHYYRPTADGRILWGGYDAVHEFASAVNARRDQREASLLRLSQHFFATFPQLRGVRFSHAWGGAIDTCTRFSAFFGTAHRGRVAYAAGYTGLGVGASRWGGRVALDLADGRDTESTRLQAVRRQPLPFPPEPLRSPVIAVTQRALEQADASAGRRGPLLRTMDALGVGVDS